MKAIVQTPTPDLAASIAFYQKLGFTILSEANPTHVSDGQVIIEINPNRYARAGLKIYDTTWDLTVKDLRKITTVADTDDGYVFSGPTGTWIYLMETEAENDLDISKLPPSTLGNFMGLSLESIPMEDSLKAWEILGYSIGMGSAKDGFMALGRENSVGVSIMKPFSCPHLFFNPSLTYFNGKNNLGVIEKVRQAGITITEEITHFNKEGIVDNIIIRDPGGLGFFVFND